jgi:hypothetical protein
MFYSVRPTAKNLNDYSFCKASNQTGAGNVGWWAVL